MSGSSCKDQAARCGASPRGLLSFPPSHAGTAWQHPRMRKPGTRARAQGIQRWPASYLTHTCTLGCRQGSGLQVHMLCEGVCGGTEGAHVRLHAAARALTWVRNLDSSCGASTRSGGWARPGGGLPSASPPTASPSSPASPHTSSSACGKRWGASWARAIVSLPLGMHAGYSKAWRVKVCCQGGRLSPPGVKKGALKVRRLG